MSGAPDMDKMVIHGESDVPRISLTRIKRINTYEVMDSDLETLDQLVSDENRALGFASLTLGVFVSTAVSLLTSSTPPTPNAYGVYTATIGLSGALSAWFSLVFFQTRKRRPRLLDRIRNSSSTIEQRIHLEPHSTP
jgi:hypothetical protein